jgi:hypothetical protein
MNCIHLSRPDYPAISRSVIVPTPAPGLKNSRDTAPAIEDLIAFQPARVKEWGNVISLWGYFLVRHNCKTAK